MADISPLELKFRFVLGLICVVVFISVVFVSTYRSYERSNEFPRLDLDDQLSGIVTSVEKERSWIRVTLDNKIKRTIYSPVDLVDFISPGDFFEKKLGNDSIHIIRQNKIYSFH